MTVRINPSILSADFVNMERDLGHVSNADFVHVDVMDNHFVPNLTFGPQMVGRIKAVSTVPLDVHLMIDDNDRWAAGYAELGAESVTFHVESTKDPAHAFDQILVMTVEPGFAGQKFMGDQLEKVRQVAQFRQDTGTSFWIEVDGGVDEDTISLAAEAGADTFVAGSAVYSRDNPALTVENLRKLAQTHRHH